MFPALTVPLLQETAYFVASTMNLPHQDQLVFSASSTITAQLGILCVQFVMLLAMVVMVQLLPVCNVPITMNQSTGHVRFVRMASIVAATTNPVLYVTLPAKPATWLQEPVSYVLQITNPLEWEALVQSVPSVSSAQSATTVVQPVIFLVWDVSPWAQSA